MTFTYQGRELELFDHPYNATLTNERAVEIPIAFEFLRGVEGDGLEVGNVLAHYDSGKVPDRRIVDRYEDAPGVENFDVLTIDLSYDWIVSISTIEHVRYPHNRMGGVAALAYLCGLLRPNGRMLITFGFGQNAELDSVLDEHRFGGTWRTLSRWRTDQGNEWYEAWPEEEQQRYGPTHGANAVWIGEWGPA